MIHRKYARCGLLFLLSLPLQSHAQGIAQELNGFHGLLDQLYEELMPLCSQLIGVGQGIAGFAALWYISSRVWRHLAQAEPIDFYPLFRPFCIGFCILMFPAVLSVMNGILKPVVTATSSMVKGSNTAIAVLLAQKEAAIKSNDVWQMYVGEDGAGDRDRWYKYTHDQADPKGEGILDGLGNDIKFAMSKASYGFRHSVKEWLSEVLQILFEAAALCINVLRTFQLVVLSILGPLVFGLSVFDGFQHTLTVWIARYINVYLWLPIANIFGSLLGKIQEKMLALDISQVHEFGDTFFSRTDMAYLIFMVIGIVGYFTVPSVANYVVHAGGESALGQKITQLFASSSSMASTLQRSTSAMENDQMGNAASLYAQGMAASSQSSPYFNDAHDPSAHPMGERLKGNS